jgi:lipoprotein-releasing system permease protein
MLRQKGRFSAFIIRLAMVATALSVAAMIIAMALIVGFKQQISRNIYNYWGHIHVTLYSPASASIISPDPMVLDKAIAEQIMAQPGVLSMTPYAIRPVIVNANQLMEGIQLKGVDNSYDFHSIQSDGMDFSDSAYSKEILLSKTTMNRLKLKDGDELLLYFLDANSTVPRIRKATVAGSYHTGMEDIDAHYAICDIRLLQRINLWNSDQVNGYQLTLANPEESQATADKIFNEILPRETQLVASSMYDLFPGIFDWLKLLDTNALVVIIIMSIVAIINLVAALLILIVNQARMVGLLKALGMPEGQMRQIFLYHAALIGFTGIVIGNIIAIGLCVLQQQTGFLTLSETAYSMQYVPVQIIGWHPVVISMCTLLLCILCMWVPTLYIRRVQPAKVLQFK